VFGARPSCGLGVRAVQALRRRQKVQGVVCLARAYSFLTPRKPRKKEKSILLLNPK
jgi:hypothetical protein